MPAWTKLISALYKKRWGQRKWVITDLSNLLSVYTKLLQESYLKDWKKYFLLPSLNFNLTFVANRQILDASLIANELIDEWEKNKSKGVIIKLHIEKAFDKVDWEFLNQILLAKGFGTKWHRWIKGCLSSASFSIIISGRPRGKIVASKGLRQRDPPSPFLFTLVMDCSSRMLLFKEIGDWLKALLLAKLPMPSLFLTSSLLMTPSYSLLMRRFILTNFLYHQAIRRGFETKD